MIDDDDVLLKLFKLLQCTVLTHKICRQIIWTPKRIRDYILKAEKSIVCNMHTFKDGLR